MLLSALRPVLLLLSLLAWLPASATTLLRVDLQQLSTRSDAVVHGTVRRVESRWSGDKRRILTDVEVEVIEPLKGQPGRTVLVTHPGGQIGEIGQKVSGLASFSPGEEVVLFLERRGPQAFRVTAMAQGKFRVERSADGRTALALPEPLGDTVLIDPGTGGPTASALKPLTLAELKASIRAALQQPARPQEKRP